MNKFTPKNYKYIKLRKRLKFKKTKELKYIDLKHGDYGLKVLESGQISSAILETCRRAISKYIKKNGKLWITINPNVPLTKKPIGVRMGKGHGNLDKWIYPIKKGKIIFEIKTNSPIIAKYALISASKKLPVKSKFIVKT